MTVILTAAEMRAVELAAMSSGGVTGLGLMERAGRGVVDAIFKRWPDLARSSHCARVLCGPGNNGGDGLVVARLLKEWGWEVGVSLLGAPGKLPPDANVNLEMWRQLAGTEPDLRKGNADASLAAGPPPDLLVDALFGTGLCRPLGNPFSEELERWGGFPAEGGIREAPSRPRPFRVVSVDIPSGLCSDSGRVLGASIRADLTATFHAPKRGHFLDRGMDLCGMLEVVSLGIDDRSRMGGANAAPDPETGVCLAGAGAGPGWLRKVRGHKYDHGNVLVVSGGPGRTGAARLAARGALRIGAGLVTIACPETALAEVACQTTAVMCRVLDDAAGLREALEDDRLAALCLGPGLGVGREARALVMTALAAPRSRAARNGGGARPNSGAFRPEDDREGGRPVVLDADALTCFKEDPETLFDALHEDCVLTPHAGEFGRLFPDIADRLAVPATAGPAYSKIDATREAARRAGCTILFKGPDTVISDSGGRCVLNSSVRERDAPWLATAGSGDVLAGFITGLIARGFAPLEAAEAAAWMHTECALSFGPGLVAEDMPEELPKVFRQLA